MYKLIPAFCLFLVLLVPMSVEASTKSDEFAGQIKALTDYLDTLQRPYGILTADEEKEVIANSVEWILASQKENGHYGYEYWPYEDIYTTEDNIVRQAGTFSSLADVYAHQTVKDEAIGESLVKSLEYFQSLTIEVEEEDDDVVYEFSCIIRSAGYYRCDLGATALVLVGLFRFVDAEPERREEYGDLIEDYVDFLLAAKRPEAGFSNRYLKKGGFVDEESPFFNGEAMLALVRYYQYEPNHEVRVLLEDLFEYLSEKRYESPLYLWIMTALKDMYALWPSDAYAQYAQDFTEVRLVNATRQRGTTHNYCAPLEGMVAAYSVLEDTASPSFLARLYTEIEYWLHRSSKLQLDGNEPYRVVFIDGELSLLRQEEEELAHGGFLTGETELTQRIDFTQHCVSAYLQKYVDIDDNVLD